jgi:hypothetical protein
MWKITTGGLTLQEVLTMAAMKVAPALIATGKAERTIWRSRTHRDSLASRRLSWQIELNRWSCWVKSYEKKGRNSLCGCDAVQHANGYSENRRYAITFDASAVGNGNSYGKTD